MLPVAEHSLAVVIRAIGVLALGSSLSGMMTPAEGAGEDEDAASRIAALPASYSGILPCRNCSERKILLNLRPDDVFHLREEETFEDTDTTRVSDDIGVWELSEDGDTLLLHPTLGKVIKLTVEGKETLTMVDRETEGSASELSRMKSYQTIEPRLFLRGKFSIRGRERVFRECVTGKRMIVEETGDYARLEKAYRKYRPDYGRDLLISLQGRIVTASRSQSGDYVDRLVVDRYGGLWPVEVCGRWISLAALENTFWFLMNLGDEAILTPMTAPEPYLRLDGNSGRFEMVDGCNRLRGDYQLAGDEILFGKMAGSTRDCPEGVDRASAFQDALQATASWSIKGALLRIYDQRGELIAWFEPRFKKHESSGSSASHPRD